MSLTAVVRGADGLRLAVGTFSAVRVRPPARVDPRSVRGALRWAPLVGALLGAAGGVVLEVVRAASRHSVAGTFLAAALGIGTVAVLSRCVHLDGLADTVDGLGSGRPPDQALEVMRRSDVGPFAVVALVLVLVVQVACAAESVGRGTGWLGLVVAVAAGRSATVWGCVRGVPPARSGGLGAAFAGAMSLGSALTVTLLTAAGAAAVAGLDDDRSPWLSLRAAVAVLLAAAVAIVVVQRCVRRLGGVTGDVLGAAVECATTAALLCFALL